MEAYKTKYLIHKRLFLRIIFHTAVLKGLHIFSYVDIISFILIKCGNGVDVDLRRHF